MGELKTLQPGSYQDRAVYCVMTVERRPTRPIKCIYHLGRDMDGGVLRPPTAHWVPLLGKAVESAAFHQGIRLVLGDAIVPRLMDQHLVAKVAEGGAVARHQVFRRKRGIA